MIRSTLDEDGCIDLLSILRVINQINQEQAWATCHQLASLMQRLSPANCAPIESLAQIYLHKDGFVHEKSLQVVAQHIATNRLSPSSSSSSPTSSSSPSSSSSSSNSNSSSNDSTPTSTPTNDETSTTASNLTETNAANSTRPINRRHIDCSTTEPHQNKQQSTPTTTTTTRQTNQQQQQLRNYPTTVPPTTPPTPPITPELNEILRRRPALNESELVASLGIALFWALDYGIPDDEERKLSDTMECLIVQSQNKLSLDELMEICINRLPLETKSHAESHYRSVCKSLVSDTIELSIFLEKIYTASMVLSDITIEDCLDNRHHHHHHQLNHKCDISDDLSELGEPLASLRALRINEWARLWMQVIRELRQRGRFKQAMAVN